MTDYRSLSTDELWTALGQADHLIDLDLIRACLERRKELTPVLLKALEDGPDPNWEYDDPRCFFEIHAGFLLCAFRDPAALPVFGRVFRDPDRENLLEWFARDLPAAYGPAAIPMLIEWAQDESVYPYSRSIAMAMLVVVAQDHPDEYDRIVAAFHSLLPDLNEDGALPSGIEDSEMWTWIALSLADLKDEASLPQIMALYRAGMIEEETMGNEEQYLDYLYQQVDEQTRHYDVLEVYKGLNQMAIRRAEAEAAERERAHLQAERERLEAELAERLAERERLVAERERLENERERLQNKQAAAASTRSKIGRNDPCWCGSGKKYKRCHWREDRRKR